MHEDSPKKTRGSPALRKNQECDSSMLDQNKGSSKDKGRPARTKLLKRKASPERVTLGKRLRLPEPEQPSTSEEDVTRRGTKRRAAADDEGPNKKMKKSPDQEETKHVTKNRGRPVRTRLLKRKTSPKQVTLAKMLRLPELQHPSTSEEDVTRKGTKKRAAADDEGQNKKMKKSPDQEETKQETQNEGRPVKTRLLKRKTSPERVTLGKRLRLPEPEQPSTSEEDVTRRGTKRRAAADDEGPNKKMKKSPDQEETKQETKNKGHPVKTRLLKRKTSPERVTLGKRLRLPEPEQPSTSEEDVTRRGAKRRAAVDDEGQNKKMKKSPDQEETKQETQNEGRPVKTRLLKRKTSPEWVTLGKRLRLPEPEQPCTSEEDVRVRGVKRRVREDGEGPKKKLVKRRLDQIRNEETASSSADSERGSCHTSAEDVTRRGAKRRAAASGEGLTKKRKKRPDQEETKDETKEKIQDDLLKEARAEFEAKYEQQGHLGQGGCGCVFAGYRKSDNLPVAIKHVPKDKVFCKHKDASGQELSVEVAVMLELAAGPKGSAGESAPISLLDWYDLDQELILVLERPIPSKDLHQYISDRGGSLREEEAKIILKQLINAVIVLNDKCIFHRDIKLENVLIETGSDVPRVRIIDFGLSCFTKKNSRHRLFYGTSAHTPPEWYKYFAYMAGPTTVWQLGVVLFEMLHRAGFETMSFLRKRLRISKRLSEDCQDFLRTCLTENSLQRITLEELQYHPWLR